MSRLRVAFDAIVTVVILVACVGIIRVTFFRPAPKAPQATAPLSETGYVKGDLVTGFGGIDWAASSATLVVYVSSNCKFCTESMAFYRQLLEAPRAARVIVAGAEAPASLTTYLGAHGIKPDGIVTLGGSSRFKGTPTLMLVGNDAVVRETWLGRLDPSAEKAVFDSVR